jgi:putative hemolysin
VDKILVLLATSPRELRAHLRVRWTIFGKEEGYLPHERRPVSMEFDPFDRLGSTRHFIALARRGGPGTRAQVIGAGRLVLPAREVARANGWAHGLPLEAKVDLDLSMVGPPGSIAEVGRLCIQERWRAGTVALPELCIAMCMESLRHGVEHWISVANLHCDSEDEARLIHESIKRRGLLRTDIPARSRARIRPATPPRFRVYTERERRRAEHDDEAALRLPRAVSSEAKLGARYVGEPLWDEHFGMFTMPLVAAVHDVLRAARRYRRSSSCSARCAAPAPGRSMTARST